MARPGARPRSFESLRRLPVIGRAMDWGMCPSRGSPQTLRAGTRIAGLKVTESVCPYCPAKVRYRAPRASDWQELGLDDAMDMIAARVIAAREHGLQECDHHGRRVDRTLAFAHLGVALAFVRAARRGTRPHRGFERGRR